MRKANFTQDLERNAVLPINPYCPIGATSLEASLYRITNAANGCLQPRRPPSPRLRANTRPP